MHRRVKKFLESMHRLDRVPNALLFFGREGVGKKTLAFEFAKSLLCLKGSYPPCGECMSCNYMEDFSKEEEERLRVYGEGQSGKQVFLYLQGEHPDFILVKPEKGEIKIDQIRGVKDFLNLRPALSKRKVVMITQGESMNPYSQNALLKALEEPPEDTHFLIVTDNLKAILPTIRSRCFLIDVPPLSKEELVSITGIEDESLLLLAEGSLTRLKLLSEKKNLLDMADVVLSDDVYKLYTLAQSVDNMAYEDQKLLLSLISAKLSLKLKENKHLYPLYERALDVGSNLTANLNRGIRLSLGLFRINLIIGGDEHVLHKGALLGHTEDTPD